MNYKKLSTEVKNSIEKNKEMDKINKFKIRNILIICLNGLGDVINTTPLIRSVRKEYPNAKLTLLVKNKFMKNVFGDSQYIDEFIYFDPSNKSLLKRLQIIKTLRSKCFDLSITTTDTDLIKGPMLVFLAQVKYRVGEIKKRKFFSGLGFLYNYPVQIDYQQHRVESNLNLFRKISSSEVIDETFFSINGTHEIKKENLLKKNFKKNFRYYVTIHPGCRASESYRRWPIERYLIVAKEIVRCYRIPVIFVGGQDEIDIFNKIDKAKNQFIYNGINELSIGATAALIRDSIFIIGNDSGLMHIAGAVKTPTIDLMASVSSLRCAPWKNNNEVIEPSKTINKKERIKEISVKQVLEAVDRIMMKNSISKLIVN